MSSSFVLGADGVYRCEELSGFEFAVHGFGSRLANPPVDVTLRQIHSDLVLNAGGLADRERDGDALVSDDVGTAIGVRTADCVPILLLDAETHAVAAVHAGWRGTAGSILAKVVGRMAADFGSKPGNLYAAIGPCIQECCYQVGRDVARHFVAQFPEWTGKVGQRHLNLSEANRRQLAKAGIPQSQVFQSSLCTSCLPQSLYSFRREPANPGRMVAAISRVS